LNVKLRAWAYTIKPITAVIPHRNKLECLSLCLFSTLDLYMLEPNQVKTIKCTPSLARKYYTKVEVNDSDKRTSLLRYGVNHGRKKFNTTSLQTLKFQEVEGINKDLVGAGFKFRLEAK
jgi:hypothetical protein